MNLSIDHVENEEREWLKNFLAYYLHDLSEFAAEISPKEEGLFEFDVMDLFLEKRGKGLDAFFIKLDGAPIGFVLLQSGEYSNQEFADYVLNSFFILRKYRRKGIGSLASKMFFEMYPGRYTLGQLVGNKPAVDFWKSCYKNNSIEYYERMEVDGAEKINYQYFRV
ncbi:GNAT family N-acetyltransferase [Paenibacillus pabuli]|uniref:GNAT family N-acetyltransferase n=1 Tax=Paenibacillus pabuli TaxID=1472 RepID=UPI003CF2C959